ncbi:hypothetical protein OESDEN_05665 [Oesophagostomum dentatum]|uniref:Peptidase A2 domain-containing protein n=1 Tax=Oesophagostomum dentatum TaxID=61180 RepID=A0A0B1TEZ4_OESDE|nr:hypothetical protein OESDEN_05665 [Oesophagostomum dentatum]
MSEKVLCEEQKEGRHLSTDEILKILENTTAMKGTIALTTDAFQDRFNVNQSRPPHYREASGHYRDPPSRAAREVPRNQSEQKSKQRVHCICGSSAHGISQCTTFTTPEARRSEAIKRKLCWKCFNNNHKSSDCRFLKACPRCGKDHHSSLCMTERSTGNGAIPQRIQTQPRSSYQGPNARREGTSQNAELVCPETNSSNETRQEQYVLMTATALAFNMDTMDYEPVTIFFDTGAQKSFINSDKSTKLRLPIARNTSFTTQPRSSYQGQYARRQGASQNAELVCPETNSTNETRQEQYVLMTATALAFNMDTMDYEPVTIFF